MPVRSRIVTLESISRRRRLLFNMARPLPLFTALIMVLCTAVFIFQLVDLAPSPSSVCLRPVSIFPKFQLYRVLVDPFFHGGFLHVGLNLFSFYILGSDFENQVGTLGASFVISLIIIPFSGIAHTALAYLFDALSGMTTRYNCAIGISGVLFALIVLALEMSRAEAMSFFGLFALPTRVYPWFLLAVLSLLSPGLSFMGHLAGIVVGYGISFGLFGPVLPSDSTLDEFETYVGLKSLPLYKANPICNGDDGLNIWSHRELPTTREDQAQGENGSSQVSQWFQVLKAWLNGLTGDSSRISFPGEGHSLSGASEISITSRLTQQKPPTSVPEHARADVRSPVLSEDSVENRPAPGE